MPPGICAHGDGVESTVGEVIVADGLEVICHFYEYLLVEPDVIAELLERIVQRLGSRLRGAAGEGGDRGVDNVGAGMHDIVLAEEYFALNKERYKAMSVVAIVENVFRDA